MRSLLTASALGALLTLAACGPAIVEVEALAPEQAIPFEGSLLVVPVASDFQQIELCAEPQGAAPRVKIALDSGSCDTESTTLRRMVSPYWTKKGVRLGASQDGLYTYFLWSAPPQQAFLNGGWAWAKAARVDPAKTFSAETIAFAVAPDKVAYVAHLLGAIDGVEPLAISLEAARADLAAMGRGDLADKLVAADSRAVRLTCAKDASFARGGYLDCAYETSGDLETLRARDPSTAFEPR